MRKIQYYLLALLFTINLTSIIAQHKLDEFIIVEAKNGNQISWSDFVKTLYDYDILLFGEEHNDAIAHSIQFQLLETLYLVNKTNQILSLEMFDRDVQFVLDEYLTEKIKEKHFKKDARVWSNYDDYKAMIEFSKTNGLMVIAANAPSRYANLAGRLGIDALKSLPNQSKNGFAPLPIANPATQYVEKLNAMMTHTVEPKDYASKKQSHNTHLSFDLITAQNLWDATMAYSISEAIKKDKKAKVLHINGRFHSDEFLGIFSHLKIYAPKRKIAVISCLPDERFKTKDFKNLLHLGDFIIITNPDHMKSYE